MPPSREILTNAQLVLPGEILPGTLVIEDGLVQEVQSGLSRAAGARDLGGDWLLPGLIELHTDNLEKHLEPRPGVRWPPLSALLIHDAQIAAAGITTVFDALFIGDLYEGSVRADGLHAALQAIDTARGQGLLRAEHLLHLRCELSCPNMLESALPLLRHAGVKLLSVMDHTPGQRQWRRLDKFRQYMQGSEPWSDAHLQAEVQRLQALQQEHAHDNRMAILQAGRARGLALASHDDTLAEHVEQAHAEGITVCEFPTTVEAARAARAHGLGTIVGAPNLVRGASHSGNVSALELARQGLVDAISSDYVPYSLLQSAFLLHTQADWPLHDAVAAVSATPARMVGLTDRGALVPGLRADMVRVRCHQGSPVAMETWRAGMRIA